MALVMAKSLDDSQLLKLASDPRSRLFPPLRGATVFIPLIVIAGIIPCLAALQAPELDDVGAGWGLRALDVVHAVTIQDWLEPGRLGLGYGFMNQPPLSTWLLAIVAPQLGVEHLNSWRCISLGMCCCTIWGACLLARRLGGAAVGLMTAILLSLHPVMFVIAARIGPASLGSVLMIASYWGFLSHLEGPAQLLSIRLLIGAVAWGLSLLAIGPVALMLLIPVLIQTWLLQEGKTAVSGTWSSRLSQMWVGMRTFLVFLVTALSFSAWWQVMMATGHRGDFVRAWATGLVELNFQPETPSSFWRVWLLQNSALCGWLVLGLFAVLSELRRPTDELTRRRCQFLLLWWLTAVAMRTIFDMSALRSSCLISTWDAMLLVPTAIMAAWGGRAFVMRSRSLSGEAFAVILTVSLAVWRQTELPVAGVGAFLLGWLGVVLFPTVMATVRGGPRRWNERDWRRLMRTSFVATLAFHVVMGLWTIPRPSAQSRSLTELRQRTSAISSTERVTLLASNNRLPESLLFILRTQWPRSELILADRTGTRRTPPSPARPELFVEWAQSDGRITNEIPPDRQATAVGDPLRYRGKRLMIYEVVARSP